MFIHNLVFKVLIPLNLLLLIGVTACGEKTLDTDKTGTSTPPSTETSVEKDPVSNEDEKTPASNSVIALSGEGVVLVNEQTGSTKTIAFDTDLESSQLAISKVLGDPTDNVKNEECGAGPMRFVTWSNGFTINSLQDQFVGWTVRPQTESAALTTIDGVGLGTTLADVKASYETEVFDSTLGIEFSAADKLFGLLSANAPSGVVTNLWAGVACNFR